MAKAILELVGVSARYEPAAAHRDEEGQALEGISLRVEPGDLLAVLGPNGAGKTTLLRVLAGTLAPTDGAALLGGEPMSRTERSVIARSLAVVSQVESVAFGFSVREVVAMGRAPHQGAWMRPSADDERIVESAMKRCDLLHLAGRAADQLSGGEQKRVAIARALAQQPRVLLLDEPGAFLDARHQVELHELLVEEVAQRNLACVVVMHDLNAAAQYASRIALLSCGRLTAIGKVEEVMTYRQLREIFGVDLYAGLNELTGHRYFLPMRRS